MHQSESTLLSGYSSSELSLFSVLVIIDSLHFIFARALHPYLPPSQGALLVLAIATVQVGLYGTIRRQIDWRAWRTHWLFLTTIGILVAVSTTVNYAAVGFIDPGTASMLGKAGTLYALAFSIIWLRENLSRTQALGAGLAIFGVFVVTFQPGDYMRLGSLMILFSTLLYALHTAVVKRYGSRLDLINFFFYRLLSTSIFLMIIALGQGDMVAPPAQAWGVLLVAATVDVTLSRSLYYLALRRLPMTLHSVILTVSPVIAILWSIFFFRAVPTVQQMVGGVAVLIGVFLTMQRRSPT